MTLHLGIVQFTRLGRGGDLHRDRLLICSLPLLLLPLTILLSPHPQKKPKKKNVSRKRGANLKRKQHPGDQQNLPNPQ